MKIYTASFAFEKEPSIKKSDGWLGGKLLSVQFSDALEELEILKAKLDEIKKWYDTDGSVGGLANIMDNLDV